MYRSVDVSDFHVYSFVAFDHVMWSEWHNVVDCVECVCNKRKER